MKIIIVYFEISYFPPLWIWTHEASCTPDFQLKTPSANSYEFKGLDFWILIYGIKASRRKVLFWAWWKVPLPESFYYAAK